MKHLQMMVVALALAVLAACQLAFTLYQNVTTTTPAVAAERGEGR
jgi:hypothetical protein